MTWLERILPAPLTSALLLAVWLLLARSASAGQVALGLALAVMLPMLSASLRPARFRVRRPLLIVRYIATVGGDVVRSSFEVAWGVVSWGRRPARSRFVVVPLDLREPVGLAALALVTTVVPGTVWSELALDRSAVLLHVWDVAEDATFIARYKARYEQPLREIFE